MLLEKPMFWMKPEQLLAPFNCSQIKESFNNDNYFDMTVSSIIARQEGGRRSSSVKAVFGVVKALSRIALLDSGKTESLHFGGYARCDNGYVFEYYELSSISGIQQRVIRRLSLTKHYVYDLLKLSYKIIWKSR